MEEDIKYLEDEIVNNDIVLWQWFEDLEYDEEAKLRQAIENLIAGYKELKENHINPSKVRFTYYDNKKGTKVVIEGFISKTKIKEKIEELNLKLAEDVNGKMDATYNIRFTIQVLQELLESED